MECSMTTSMKRIPLYPLAGNQKEGLNELFYGYHLKTDTTLSCVKLLKRYLLTIIDLSENWNVV